jgi:hypothetical protein
VDPVKVEKVQNWPVPTSVTALLSFLGFVNYHREHIPHLALVAAPLYQLTKKDAPFEWGPCQEEAFHTLKRALTQAPLLAFPLPSGDFILDTDASDGAIGAELSQVQNGQEKVIAYASHSLNPAQKNYCTTRKELLAVVMYTRHFRHYLLGRSFYVRTDHVSLAWLMRFKQPTGQLARWLEELSQYDLKIVHRPGRNHGNADALSRLPNTCDCYNAGSEVTDLPCGGCPYCTRAHTQWERFSIDVDVVVPLAVRVMQVESRWLENYTAEDLRVLQEKDPDLAAFLQWMDSQDAPEPDLALASKTTKYLWQHRDQLHLSEPGVLLYRWEEDDGGGHDCLVVPQTLRHEVMALEHATPSGGHFALDKMLSRLWKRFYWPGMSRDCAMYIEGCSACNQSKKANRRSRSPLGTYHAGVPMQRVHMDILGPFPASTSGNMYVLMVVDRLRCWSERSIHQVLLFLAPCLHCTCMLLASCRICNVGLSAA